MITKEYSFGKIFIHDCYVIAIMKEGIVVKVEYNLVLKEISETYFKNKKFGYITNRINSYSVDPSIYLETNKIKNLVAFAIISNNPMNLLNSEIEKMFFKKPFEHFYTIVEGIGWVKATIKNLKETTRK